MELKAFLPEAWTQFRTLFRKFFKKTFVGTRAEWDALTTTEKQEYDIANITDDPAGGGLVVVDAVAEGDLNPVTSNAVAKTVNYSTDEVKTGAKWIDGKPIYRKVVDCGNIPAGVHDAEPMADFSSMNIDKIWRGEECFTVNEQLVQSIVYLNPRHIETSVGVQVTNTGIYLFTNMDRSQMGRLYMTVEYTKTTD